MGSETGMTNMAKGTADITRGAASDTTSAFPFVRVVVVNWNQWRTTVGTLQALERIEYPRFEVVVVDNGSSDDSADRLAAWLASRPGMSLTRLPENRGFAGGVNAGILAGMARAAETARADYFWLLNNDAVPEPSALGHLVMALEQDSSAAAAGSLILYADAPSLVWAAGGDIVPWWGITRH
ncbi:MAG: glycosyltransferase, partial [Bacillota bacterium]